jgi:uncharacterized Zn finger protein
LERYSDYSNRIPRGRSYVRNGSVVDLQLSPGKAVARVSGSRLYTVEVKIAPVGHAQWQKICRDCAGGIDSLVELLRGRFSKAVMARVCEPGTGLFPAPSEIVFKCSCPDWASMCKHVAAVLYGVGARLDERPELLFRLRQVDESDLIAHAAKDVPLSSNEPASDKVLDGAQVADLFGLEMAQAAEPECEPLAKAQKPAVKRVRAKPATRGRPRPPSRPKALPSPGFAAAVRAMVADEVRTALKPLGEALDGIQGLTGDARPAPAASAVPTARRTTRFAQGQVVHYRQGRGTFPAKVVSVDSAQETVLLERVKDGKQVIRPAAKVIAP